MTEKVVKKTSKNRVGDGTPGPGRPKGAQNKATKQLKEMILGALSAAGGQKYLLTQAKESPVAFMTLLGKLVPAELKAELSGPNGEPLQAAAPVYNLTIKGK